MATYRGAPIRTAFGRPMSARAGDAPGLAWLFVLLMIGGVVVAQLVTQAAGAEMASSGAIARLFGSGTPQRVRMGYVPPAEAGPDTADVAAPSEPPAAVVPGVAEPVAAPAAVPTTDRFRVANTDGMGVVLHTAPSRDARVPRGLIEGTSVTVLERVGSEWAHVRSDSGQEGWIGAAYLAPLP